MAPYHHPSLSNNGSHHGGLARLASDNRARRVAAYAMVESGAVDGIAGGKADGATRGKIRTSLLLIGVSSRAELASLRAAMATVVHANDLTNESTAGSPSPSAPLLSHRILFHLPLKTSSSAQSASSLSLIPINTIPEHNANGNEDPNFTVAFCPQKPNKAGVEDTPSCLRSAPIQRISAYLNSGQHKASFMGLPMVGLPMVVESLDSFLDRNEKVNCYPSSFIGFLGLLVDTGSEKIDFCDKGLVGDHRKWLAPEWSSSSLITPSALVSLCHHCDDEDQHIADQIKLRVCL